MKKTLLIGLISLGLIGCSSLELGDALSSEQYTQNILDLGLTHEENLIEASKLKTPHLVSVVTLQLTNARDEKIQYENDLIESKKFAEQVVVSNDGSQIIAPQESQTTRSGVLESDYDLINYYLEGTKDSNNSYNHKLHLSISHNSKSEREYIGANLCNKWGQCESVKEDGSSNALELKTISSNASNCSSYNCDFSETLEIKFNDYFLKDSSGKPITFNLISKKKSKKISISAPYLMGYLSSLE
jgi:uncharacterized protein YcfL